MKQLLLIALLLGALSCVFSPGSAQAARRRALPPAPKTYQVTGPVLEVTNDLIVVQKGKERWEVARDSSTKVTGDLKVGAHVTIQYRMTAASVSVQAAKPAAAAKPKAKP
jgi:hypothetical protein